MTLGVACCIAREAIARTALGADAAVGHLRTKYGGAVGASTGSRRALSVSRSALSPIPCQWMWGVKVLASKGCGRGTSGDRPEPTGERPRTWRCREFIALPAC